MKNWFDRVLGPAVAKVTMPRLLLCVTGSSGIRSVSIFALSAGLPLKPNCAMNPGKTPEKADVLEVAFVHQSVESVSSFFGAPCAGDFHGKIALRCRKLRPKGFGRRRVSCGRERSDDGCRGRRRRRRVCPLHAAGINCNAMSARTADACLRCVMAERVKVRETADRPD